MGGYYPVIFLDPRVLMKPESAFTEQDRVEFDQASCNAFRSLIERVYNVAVVLVLPSGQTKPSHGQIEAAYRALDFSARIIGKISAPLDGSSCAFAIGRPVDDWLRVNPLKASSFVLLERRDGWVYYKRSIVLGKSERLTEETVDRADEILTHMGFSPYQLARLH